MSVTTDDLDTQRAIQALSGVQLRASSDGCELQATDVDVGRLSDELTVAIKLWMGDNGGAAHWKMFDILRTRVATEYRDPLKAEEIAIRRMWIAIWHSAEGMTLEDTAAKLGVSLTTAKADKRALEAVWLELRETEDPWRPDAGDAD